MFAPGLVCVGLGVFVFESTLVIVLGVVLLVAPLVVQMFGPDWDRETIPEGHHHDHSGHDPDHDHSDHDHSDHDHSDHDRSDHEHFAADGDRFDAGDRSREAGR